MCHQSNYPPGPGGTPPSPRDRQKPGRSPPPVRRGCPGGGGRAAPGGATGHAPAGWIAKRPGGRWWGRRRPGSRHRPGRRRRGSPAGARKSRDAPASDPGCAAPPPPSPPDRWRRRRSGQLPRPPGRGGTAPSQRRAGTPSPPAGVPP